MLDDALAQQPNPGAPDMDHDPAPHRRSRATRVDRPKATGTPQVTVANDRYRAPDIGNSQEMVTPKMVVAQKSNYEMAAISVTRNSRSALSWEQKGCLRGILDVEANDLAFLKVEDMPDRFVPQPVRLILQRRALQIADGLTNLDDD